MNQTPVQVQARRIERQVISGIQKRTVAQNRRSGLDQYPRQLRCSPIQESGLATRLPILKFVKEAMYNGDSFTDGLAVKDTLSELGLPRP